MITALAGGARRLLALALLAIASPVVLGSATISAIENRSNGVFTQVRVGKNGRLFRLIKLQTMRSPGDSLTGVSISGRYETGPACARMRSLKLDELPQLINVARGEMNFIGPRPDLPGILLRTTSDAGEGNRPQKWTTPYSNIVASTPGITGPASLRFSNEEKLLAAATGNPLAIALEVLLPVKDIYARHYAHNRSLVHDAQIIAATVFPRFRARALSGYDECASCWAGRDDLRYDYLSVLNRSETVAASC